MSNDTTLLRVDNLSYTFQKHPLLQKVSFSLEKNQILCILWYNGSGKSTLLKLLLWSLVPQAWSIRKRVWLRMWYVPQKLSFERWIPLTVGDFLCIYNTTTQQEARVSCWFLDINTLWNMQLDALSWWQLQKVLIYNALLWDPHVLLLDEPTAWLDIVAQEAFYDLIDHLYKEHNMSIVLVSHDIHTVYRTSHKVICLHEGICCTWSPQDKYFWKKIHTLLGTYVVPYGHDHRG